MRIKGMTKKQALDLGSAVRGIDRAVKAQKPSESAVQRAILDYCAAERIFVQRRNVAGVQRMTGGHYVRLGTKGQSDLWGILDGRHWECEVKKPGEIPTQAQLDWLVECARAGAVAFWCDSLDGFTEQIRQIRG